MTSLKLISLFKIHHKTESKAYSSNDSNKHKDEIYSTSNVLGYEYNLIALTKCENVICY